MASEFPNEPNTPPPPPPPPPPPSMTPPPAASGMFGRIQRLFLNTVAEWHAIDGEPTTANAVFTRWAVPLAAIAPVFMLIGYLLFVGTFLFSYALVLALAVYVLTLVSTWALGAIINAMAANFSSTANMNQAMKAACYSLTAFYVAGVLNIVPDLAILALLLGLFSLFLLWIGLPIVMKTPADKAPGYVAVSGLIAIVLLFASYKIAGAIAGAVLRSSITGGFGVIS